MYEQTRSWKVGLLLVSMLALAFYLFRQRVNSQAVHDAHGKQRASVEPTEPLVQRTPLPVSRTAQAAPPKLDQIVTRFAVEAEKQAYHRLPAEDQQLTAEFMAQPELFEEGPGPHFARYGGKSGALPKSAQPEQAAATTVLDSDGPRPQLSVWVPSFRNSAGEDVTINARVIGEDGRPATTETLSVTLVEKRTQVAHQGVMQPIAAGAYTFSFHPPPTTSAVSEWDYVAYAVIRTPNGDVVRSAQGAFQVHGAVARVVTARSEVRQQGGNLVVDLPVQIAVPGEYTFYAELWGGGSGDIPIAFALEKHDQLAQGERTVSLTFGGQIINDKQVDGPFMVRNVRVRRINDFPFSEAEPVPILLETPNWQAGSFG